MKNRAVFYGPLWVWRPEQGWFTLGGVDETILLDDVKKAVNFGIRVRFDKVVDEDLIDKAKRQGWIPGVKPEEGFDGWDKKNW